MTRGTIAVCALVLAAALTAQLVGCATEPADAGGRADAGNPAVAADGTNAISAYPSALGPPPGDYVLLDGPASIPFEVYRDEIMMIGDINGQRVRMMIDNGVMWDELLLFGSPRVDAMDLTYTEDIEVGGAGEGDAVSSKLAEGVPLSFPGVSFTDQTAIVTPASQGFAEAWEADGQVCGTFFKHFVVEIDFDDLVVTLTPPADFDDADAGEALPLSPVGEGSWAFPGTVVTHDGEEIPLLLTMDIGGVMALSVSQVDGCPLTVPPGAVEASLGYAIEGEIRGHVGRFPALRIGSHEFRDVPAGFSEHSGAQSVDDSIIVGFPVLSRFNLVFDYPHETLYVTPNERFDQPLE